MAVDDAGHDKLASEVIDFALIGRKTSLVAYIDKLSILNCQSSCLWIGLVRSEDSYAFNNLICFHIVCYLNRVHFQTSV